MRLAMFTGLEELFPILENLRGDYAGVAEVTPFRERLYDIRNTAWKADLSNPKLEMGATALVSQGLGEQVQALHDLVQGRINSLQAQVEKKLAGYGDALQRGTFAIAAADIIAGGNTEQIVSRIASAIGSRSLNLAREILQVGKATSKITGNENMIEQRFYSALGMENEYAGVREWDSLLEEIRVYHDFHIDSMRRAAAGQWASFIRSCTGLNFTDVPAYNQAMAEQSQRPFDTRPFVKG
jgi:hypothetical protein